MILPVSSSPSLRARSFIPRSLFPPDISLISFAHIGRTIDRYPLARAFCLYSYKRYCTVFLSSLCELHRNLICDKPCRCLQCCVAFSVPDSEAGPPARSAPRAFLTRPITRANLGGPRTTSAVGRGRSRLLSRRAMSAAAGVESSRGF